MTNESKWAHGAEASPWGKDGRVLSVDMLSSSSGVIEFEVLVYFPFAMLPCNYNFSLNLRLAFSKRTISPSNLSLFSMKLHQFPNHPEKRPSHDKDVKLSLPLSLFLFERSRLKKGAALPPQKSLILIPLLHFELMLRWSSQPWRLSVTNARFFISFLNFPFPHTHLSLPFFL